MVEVGAGIAARSLSLVMDGVHNISDEVALAFLVLAYTLRVGRSGRFLRSANLFNSLGLLAISALLVERDEVGEEGVLEERRRVARAAHGKQRRSRGPWMSASKKTPSWWSSMWQVAHAMFVFFRSVKNSIWPSRRSRCAVSLPNAPGNERVAATVRP